MVKAVDAGAAAAPAGSARAAIASRTATEERKRRVIASSLRVRRRGPYPTLEAPSGVRPRTGPFGTNVTALRASRRIRGRRRRPFGARPGTGPRHGREGRGRGQAPDVAAKAPSLAAR